MSIHHPFVPPRSELVDTLDSVDDAVAIEHAWRKARERRVSRVVWAVVALTYVVGLGGIWLAVQLQAFEPAMVGVLTLLGGGLVAGLISAIGPKSVSSVAGGAVGVVTSGATVLAILATSVFTRGRQLRQDGELKFAPVVDGGDWVPGGGEVDVPDALRAPLAAAWRGNGRTEHASVAAFARLSLELVALGAPPELLVDAALDAVDEVRHTEACFGLARALDGRLLSPGPLPEATTAGALDGADRTERLIELAVASLVDGALQEGTSARVLARLWPDVAEPKISAMVRRIAADEGKHAAHAWDVVAWCAREGGPSVVRALRSAAASLPDTIRTMHPPEARDGSWQRYGIVGVDLEQQMYSDAVAHVQRRVADLARIGADRVGSHVVDPPLQRRDLDVAELREQPVEVGVHG